MYFISHLCYITCHVLLPAPHSIVKFYILSVFPGKICILKEKPFKCNIKFLNTWFLFLTFEGIKWTKKFLGLPVSLKMPLTNKTYLVVCSYSYFSPEFSKKSFSFIKVGNIIMYLRLMKGLLKVLYFWVLISTNWGCYIQGKKCL